MNAAYGVDSNDKLHPLAARTSDTGATFSIVSHIDQQDYSQTGVLTTDYTSDYTRGKYYV